MPADSTPLYRRLPGMGSAGMQRYRLWLAPDHLLQVASTALGEHYKRFYFADIQALVVRRTIGWIVGIVVCLLLTALFAAFILTVDETAGRIALAVVAGIFLAILGIHLALGPTCAVTVRTAVQSEQLYSLRRLRTAHKVLARLRPLIEEAQAGVRVPEAPVDPA